MGDLGALSRAVFGVQPSAKPEVGTAHFAEGIVHSVNSQGMYYTVPSSDNGMHLYGPSPFTVGAGVPGVDEIFGGTESSLVGYRCLILIASSDAEGITEPWIIGVWPDG